MSKRLFILPLALAAVSMPAEAAPVEIKMLSPTPARAPYNGKVLAPWAKKVSAESKGTLDIKFLTGFSLATHQNIYDRVTTNVVQAGWGLQSSVRGQFGKSEVAQLPLLYDSPVHGSLALWRVFKSGLIADEYKNVKVLTLFAFPHNNLHASQPISTLESLKGMKVGAFGALRIQLVKALDATPIAVPPPKLYQSMSRGLITAMVMGYSAFPSYKLQEVTKYHLDLNVGGNPGMVFMNKSVFDGLPTEARHAIDANVGEDFARSWATTAIGLVKFGQGLARKAGGHVFSKASAADREAWRKRLEPVYDTWAKATKGGPEVLAAFRAEVARASAEK